MIIGDSVRSIEILISGIGNEINLLIDVVKKRVITKNKMMLITNDQIDELLRIIRLWKNEYTGDTVLDGECFLITINMGNKIEVIKGQGSYPDNYQNLKDWISDFYE